MSEDLQAWLGRSETAHDILNLRPANFMQATLGQDPSLREGDELPLLWHWLYFLEAKPANSLGRDGHPKKGGFLPPVALPRRMWAGGRFKFHSPIIIGKHASKTSTIQSVVEKDGRSGKLCFVTVRHEIFCADVLCVTEEQDIVYREDPADGAAPPPPKRVERDPSVSETVSPSQVMLFRYSALTFNGHRIHYDVDYARDVEGYTGLVFHGPLTATLLVDLARRTVGRPLKTFQFRGQSPISGMDPFQIEGVTETNTYECWARRADGAEAMSAQATF